mgnify:CR=1 FL=1
MRQWPSILIGWSGKYFSQGRYKNEIRGMMTSWRRFFSFHSAASMTNTLSSNVIILGKPGAGKSTISRALGETPDAHSIDFGEYLRELASDTSNLLGRYVSAFWSRNNLKEIGFEYFDRGMCLISVLLAGANLFCAF